MPQDTPMQVADAVADPARLAALREADLLDTPPEEGFDQLARIAARLLNAPIALVSLVDEDRQFFKSCIGSIPEPFNSKRETPLSHSFCQYVVASKEPLLVEDARVHPLLKDNLAVAELGVVAYLGIPITTPEGLVLGTLCVIDSKPRRWSADQVETMRSLTAAVMSTIEYRSAARTSDRGGTQVQAPGGAGAAPLSAAAEALAAAASTWLNRADQYDRSVQSPQTHPGGSQAGSRVPRRACRGREASGACHAGVRAAAGGRGRRVAEPGDAGSGRALAGVRVAPRRAQAPPRGQCALSEHAGHAERDGAGD